MRSLRDKKALVTGGAAGIGRAIASQLASEGARVFILDINEPQLASTVQYIRQRGIEAVGRFCDVSSVVQIRESIREVLDQWGELDVLVNNAGVGYYGSTSDMSDPQWDRLMAINLRAPIEFSRRLLPTLLARPEAHIMNVASMYGLFATNRCTAYHTSKFGLVGFSEALRAEYGRCGLGVTALCPGFVDTDLFSSMMGKPRTPPKWLCSSTHHVASRAIHAIYRNKRMVTISPLARSMYIVRRAFPGLLDRLYHVGRAKKVRAKQIQLEGRLSRDTHHCPAPSEAA